MLRRNFLKIILGVLGMGLLDLFTSKSVFPQNTYDTIKNRLNPSAAPDLNSEREDATLPDEGVTVSLETALNSRCTGDYDDNPKIFHWSMFDKTRKITPSQIEQIRTYAKIPRFTNSDVEIKSEKSMLTFLIDNRSATPQKDWLMVESGMQQQAVGLLCAALGVGYVFNGLGVDGKSISDNKFATVGIKLNAMKPSYNGKYWSSAAPLEPNPWKKGTLPDPMRQGTKPLLSILGELKTANLNGKPLTGNGLSQLLWSARGRTPHFYKSNPWGMTIPTYQGINTISEVFLISDGTISKYINWKDKSPTHSLEKVGKIDTTFNKLLTDRYHPNNCLIVLSKNENTGRSLWEIGYQLLNMMLQAQSLGVSYKAILLEDNHKKPYQISGIKNPVAVLLFKKDG